MTGAGLRRTGLTGDTWVGLVAALAATTITPVAVPAILVDLPTSLSGALWIVGAAAAGMVAGLALAPPLSRIRGTATLLWSAELGLAATSLLCAAPATAGQLIAARASPPGWSPPQPCGPCRRSCPGAGWSPGSSRSSSPAESSASWSAPSR